ncbi:hypothetical protein HPB50_028557 [Hyalomma asiaticum]|nr:hypothetical protein HPB50_028556 [Hyalomma asiaticum]KAH6920456.1 hypothetical protein HPB50_028557 [Hyalomma asiaticum]
MPGVLVRQFHPGSPPVPSGQMAPGSVPLTDPILQAGSQLHWLVAKMSRLASLVSSDDLWPQDLLMVLQLVKNGSTAGNTRHKQVPSVTRQITRHNIA